MQGRCASIPIFPALFLLILGFRLAPRALALYHREQGGRLLIRALLVEDRQADRYEGLLFPEPLAEPRARSLVEVAHRRFLAATVADPTGARAHLWSGRAAWMLGNSEEAVEALSTYVRLQPNDPDGWWELGLIYGRLDQQVRQALYWALIPDPGDTAEIVLLGAANLVTATLSTADVETPETPVKTPYCGRGEVPRSCFVAPAMWEMSDASAAQPAGWWLPEEPVRRSVLFMHPPSRATFTVTLPVTPTALVFWVGMDPAAWERLGDGAVYRVRVNGEVAFDRVLTATEARQGWWPGQVDLSPWAGQTVRLTLETDPGPAGDAQGDWAGWGEVRLVDAGAADVALADLIRRAAMVWRAGGITARQLIEAGEAARKAGRYEEALGWYQRAAWMELGLQSTYFYLCSLVLEVLKDQERAMADLGQAVILDTGWLDQGMRFDAWYRWGKWLYSQQRSAEAEIALQRAVEIYSEYLEGSEDLKPLLSEAYRFLGLTQWAQQRMDLAVYNLRLAVHWNDQNLWAHIHLGKTLYLQDRKQVEETEKEFAYALDLRPDDVSLWVNLIQFWRWVDEDSRAKSLCNQAKERIGPDMQLKKVCSLP